MPAYSKGVSVSTYSRDIDGDGKTEAVGIGDKV